MTPNPREAGEWPAQNLQQIVHMNVHMRASSALARLRRLLHYSKRTYRTLGYPRSVAVPSGDLHLLRGAERRGRRRRLLLPTARRRRYSLVLLACLLRFACHLDSHLRWPQRGRDILGVIHGPSIPILRHFVTGGLGRCLLQGHR